MNEPMDKTLYNKVKREANQKYKTHGAFKSGWIVKTYKERGGRYKGNKTTKGLSAWFKEDWRNVASNKQYPVYRPFKKINKDTPLTIYEISPTHIKAQIKEKQKIKSRKLKPFLKKA